MLTVPALLTERGDPHAGLDSESFGLETLLEWAVRDERDHGLGDLPYPPEYPEMPGEPLRVQPSRARLPTSDAIELADEQKLDILRADLRRWKFEVGAFFDGVSADSAEEELRRIAPQHPVFRIETR